MKNFFSIYRSNIIWLCFGILFLIVNYAFAFMLSTALLYLLSFYIISFYFIYKSDEYTLLYFVFLIVFQNLILMLCADFIDHSETQLFTIIKELVVYLGAFLYFLKSRLINIKINDASFVCFCLICLAAIFQSTASISSMLISFRQLSVMFVCYYFGKGLQVKTYFSFTKCINFIFAITILVCLSGFILYILNDTIWTTIGYDKYWANKNGTLTTITQNYSNFYSWDLGIRIKRLVGISGDPLATSHFLGISLILFITLYPKKYYTEKLLVICSLFLGLSKGSIVLLFSFFFVKLFCRLRKLSDKIIIILIGSVMGMIFIKCLLMYVDSLQTATSISIHFNSFIYGLKNLSLFGNGLGTSGYNAILAGEAKALNSLATESFLATSLEQIGFCGTLMIYFFPLYIVYKHIKQYAVLKNRLLIVSSTLALSIVLESLFSASAISMLGTGLYFVLAGFIENVVRKNPNYLIGDNNEDYVINCPSSR